MPSTPDAGQGTTRPGAPGSPAVSVILITYQDEARVGRALGSALAQTYQDLEVVVVDDASTDQTRRVVDRVSAGDARVRYHRRATNSGGCGAPRNDGMDLASGRWVMFLDSDDELTPDAVSDLVTAAEQTGAEVVAGRVDRVNERLRSRRAYRPESLETTGTFGGVAERPELLADFICVNKLYRRELLDRIGARFPTDVHYEDQVFTTQVWLEARTATVVPQVVYLYYLSNEPGSESITNRRHLVANLTDRIEVNRRIDALVAARSDPRLTRVKRDRFVQHDLRLFVRDLPDRDPQFRRQFVDIVGDYLDTAGITPADHDQPDRLLLRTIRDRDAEGALDAAFVVTKGGRLVRRLVRADDRWWWDSGAATRRDPDLDVTDLVEEREKRLTHVIEAAAVEGTVVRFRGRTVDPCGILDDHDPRVLRLLGFDEGMGEQCMGPRVEVTKESLGSGWTAEIDLAGPLESLPPYAVLEFRVRVRGEGLMRRDMPVAWSTVTGRGMAVGGGREWHGRRRRGGELVVSRSGHLLVRFDDWSARPVVRSEGPSAPVAD